MKKVIFLSILVLVAAMFNGCKADEDTSLSWTNSASETVQDIAWKDNSGNVDKTWSGDTAVNATTSAQKINVLTGQGECNDSTGAPATITLEKGEGVLTASSNSATIDKGKDANLIITAVKKK